MLLPLICEYCVLPDTLDALAIHAADQSACSLLLHHALAVSPAHSLLGLYPHFTHFQP